MTFAPSGREGIISPCHGFHPWLQTFASSRHGSFRLREAEKYPTPITCERLGSTLVAKAFPLARGRLDCQYAAK
jgi:hypothetical protein